MNSKTAELLLICLAALGPVNGLVAEQLNEGEWLSGKIHYELRTLPDDAKEIWLFAKEDKSDSTKLCETEGWGNLEMHFSPDDIWIIVQDRGVSLGVRCRMFHIETGLHYREIKKPNLNSEAEKLALKRAGLPAKEISDHLYVYCLAWSGDSKMVLIKSRGRGRIGKEWVSFVWIGIYHVQDGRFSFDLAEFDRSAVDKGPLETQ
ncbi:MAG: hypothetical protein ABJB69_07815 [Spartobacteria bacterium]